jgi:hypothetical protein
MDLNEANAQTLAIAQKIVTDFKNDPANVDMKVTKLAATLLDSYNHGLKDSTAAIEQAGAKEEVKSLLLSKTFWGIAISLAAPLLKHAGLNVDSDTTDIAAQIVTAAGAVLAIWGRMSATKKVTLLGK